MDSAQTITALSAIAALIAPVLLAVVALAQRVAAMRPRVPSSRLGSIVVLCAALGSVARTAPGNAATAPITTRAIPATPAPSSAPRATAAVEPGEYVVQPGDSLWAIACRHLEARGDAPTNTRVDEFWRAIWASNRSAIGDDPDLIFPGTRLTIPEEKA
jgi:nucleoid-associated protein YgaU